MVGARDTEVTRSAASPGGEHADDSGVQRKHHTDADEERDLVGRAEPTDGQVLHRGGNEVDDLVAHVDHGRPQR